MKEDAGAGFNGVCASLAAAGYPVKLRAFSAIDRFLGFPDLPCLWIETDADIAAVARLVENLRFPGVELADCAADTPDGTCYFRCADTDGKKTPSFPLLSFSLDWQSGRFLDPEGVYPALREIRKGQDFSLRAAGGEGNNASIMNGDSVNEGAASLDRAGRAGLINGGSRYRIIMDGALLLARYNPPEPAVSPATPSQAAPHVSQRLIEVLDDFPPEPPPGAETQRAFLNCLLVSARPDAGLEFLKRSRFLDELWPELACLDDVDHSKEFHPEGNAWNHTLETFRHRKAGTNGAFELRLSLGLLLHDAGKPISASYGNRRFDGHAELGARAAGRFLKRLEYDDALAGDIFYLVRNHMLPAALKRLPLAKTGEVMSSPLFPTLMELYRCDESSSFKMLDNYYENSAAYQVYLKNLRNPYRSPDGKKMGRNRARSR